MLKLTCHIPFTIYFYFFSLILIRNYFWLVVERQPHTNNSCDWRVSHEKIRICFDSRYRGSLLPEKYLVCRENFEFRGPYRVPPGTARTGFYISFRYAIIFIFLPISRYLTPLFHSLVLDKDKNMISSRQTNLKYLVFVIK